MVGKKEDRFVAAPSVRVRAELLSRATSSVVEGLEGRTLFAGTPFDFRSTVQTLPYTLNFNQQANGLFDKDGESIGLTRVQVNENGEAASYVPSLLNLDTTTGLLSVTTNSIGSAASNYNGDNTLVNGLETTFDATTAGFQLTTRIKGPLGFISQPSEQAGIYFGPDQDNYIKLVAISRDEGPRLQFIDEQTFNGTYTHSVSSLTDIGALKNLISLDLRLVGDAASGRVTAFYSINGATYTKIPTQIQLFGTKKTDFFSAVAKAGLLTTSKNGNAIMTVNYDSFDLQPGQTLAGRPTVTRTRPADGDTDISRDAFVAADLNLPNSGVDTASLTSDTVKLYRTSDHSLVDANVNTSGGGDTLVLTPQALLDANTSYTFEVTDGVKDLAGGAFIPFISKFTTGTAGAQTNPNVGFEKVSLTNTWGEQYTSVVMGPQGQNLWAGTSDGKIFKFPIAPDGTLGTPTVITALQDANVGPRLITGFVFAPGSTEANPTIYINHGFADITNAPDWSSKMTMMSGPTLATVQDVLVGLPRAVKDHLTNQPSFGPDGALYFTQGSESSMGAPDPVWGNRAEHLLNAAMLRLDLTKLPVGVPLDVKTEAGGTYSPVVNVPVGNDPALTVYATGIRNAWDMVWTPDGKLYTATNSAASGGNTPAGPGNIPPALTNLNDTPDDFLYLVQQGGYYGQPNPLHNEYVLNGGNPTDQVDPAEIPEYPIGTAPDANWRGNVYDFGKNVSPNGMIQYKNTTVFGGALAGKLVVARFSGGDDLIFLTPGANGKIVASETGIAGARGLVDPLDLVENQTNGNLYVAEYSESDPTLRRITLLRPVVPGAKAAADKSQLVFTDVTTTGSSSDQIVTISNNGTQPLIFNSSTPFSITDDAAVSGDHAARFKVSNSAVLSGTLAVGDSVDVKVNYTANATGIQSAFLNVFTNSTNGPLKIALRGIGTPGLGGTNEPSLARILRAFNIPTIVGDGLNDSGEATTDYPIPADDSSQEVPASQLQKAGAGNVTIELLATMAKNAPSTGGVSSRIGYYTPGNRADQTELFTTGTTGQYDARTSPSILSGSTTFDPGNSPFSLYGVFPAFATAADGNVPRQVFAEDALNTPWDSVNPHKVRFFPLRNPDGSVVANAYIFTFEEFTTFDANDVVGIIRNVKIPSPGPELGLTNSDGPFSDRLVMNEVDDPTSPDGTKPDNKTHQVATVMVRNTGSQQLVLGSVSVTGNPTDFHLLTPIAPNTVIAPGGSLALQVKMDVPYTIGQPTAVPEIHNGVLTITANDADEPTTAVALSGYWQSISEQDHEPALQTMFQIFGYGTKITNPGEALVIPGQGGVIRRTGDEVLSPYWKLADSSAPITATQIGGWHTQGSDVDLFTFTNSNGSISASRRFTTSVNYAQSFYPFKAGDTAAASATFTQSGTFGFRIGSREYSDPALVVSSNQANGTPVIPPDQGFHVRFWVAKDRAGNIISNTYFMAEDSAGVNFDYNDNVYLITNIKPTSPPSMPVGLTATTSGSIKLDWSDNTEANLEGYNVYRSTSAAGTFTKVNTSLIVQSQFNDVFAPVGSQSFYRVTAIDNVGNESAAATTSATLNGDTTPPPQPGFLHATATQPGITLDWPDYSPNPADFKGYLVFRATSVSGPFTQVNTGFLTASNYSDVTAPRGVESFYQVVGVDNTGNQSTPATASATRPVDPNAPPPAPTNVNPVANTFSTITVGWTGAIGATNYIVERRVQGTSAWTNLSSAVTITSYNDSGLTGSTTYEYQITGVSENGVIGTASAIGSTTTPIAPPAAPAAPTVSTVSATQLNLSWTPVAGADSYRVERRESGGTFAEIATGVASASYSDTTGLSASKTYEYQLRAVNTSGTSGYSPIGSGATSAASSYTNATIGAGSTGATTVVNADTDFDVTSAPGNISNTADAFRFVYKQVTGDFDVIVKIPSIGAADPTSKAGLMARASLTTNSAFAMANATAADTYRLAYRTSTGATAVSLKAGTPVFPNVWVRLQRAGNLFTAFYSADGATWTQTGQQSVTMPSTLYFGMAVAAASTTAGTTAQFRSLGDFSPVTPEAPAAPATLNANATSSSVVNLTWSASAGAASYRIERRTNGGAWVEIATAATGATFVDSGRAELTTYDYQIRAQNAGGISLYSQIATATTPQAPAQPNFSFTDLDIGATPAGSTTVITPGTDFDVKGGGLAIGGTADSTHFAYQQITGDFDIKVNINSLTKVDSSSKAGLMVRSSLSADSAMMFSGATAGSTYRFIHRDATGGTDASVVGATVAYPNAWVRLQRVGNTFAAFYSTNGTTWTPNGTATVALPSTLYFGLAVSAKSSTSLATAKFRGLASLTPATPLPTPTAPASLTATASASALSIGLTWAAGANATSYRIERRLSGGTFAPILSGVTGTSYTDSTGLVASTGYDYQVRSENSTGLSVAYSPIASATTPAVVAAAFTSADINSVPAGSTTVNAEGSSYDMTAGGVDLYGTKDGFRFAYKQVTGDFDVKTQITSLTNAPSGTAKAGLMARASLSSNSMNAIAEATVAGQYRLGYRTTDGGSTILKKAGTPSYPNVWVRLTRVGNVFTGYYSSNGTTWTQSGTITIAMPSTVYLGMALSANTTSNTVSASFRNLSIP